MIKNDRLPHKHRNRNFEETHRVLIEKAAELISESGADGVSLLMLARATGINRATIYYHFATREELMSTAQEWLRDQSAKEAKTDASRWVGRDEIEALFQRNPEVIASWIDDYVTVADVRQRYPLWDRLVAKIKHIFGELTSDEPYDPEVYWALMLTCASFVPRACTNVVHPFESLERILGRIRAKAACSPEAGIHDFPKPDHFG